ncbi:MAG: DEAD/DEAH box helicase, partial [Spirochaetota bacterium]
WAGEIADLCRLPELLCRREVSETVVRYGRCRSALIETDQGDLNVGLISVMPSPVVDLAGLSGSAAAGRASLLKIRFRYGEDSRVQPPGSTDLLPAVTAASPKSPGSLENTGSPGSPGSPCFIKPNWKAEQHFISLFLRVLAEQSFEIDVDSGLEEEGLCVLAEAGALELLGGVGAVLLSYGFELRLHGVKVLRPPGKYAVKVVSSGEKWLDIETGFEMDAGFVPIEDIPARGVARAEGALYVLPAGADSDALSAALRTSRIGIRDMAMLEQISGLVSNPDHPALAEFFDLRRRLRAFSKLEETEVPALLRGVLRPYQKSGLAWLWFLHRFQLGGCLADDMGLGKTIQALAVLAKAREAGEFRQAVVVCPVSTLGNWQHEIDAFTPCFKVVLHAGPQRTKNTCGLRSSDIVLVSYATLLRDVELFRALEPDYLILDEAQAIKNPKTKRRNAVVSIRAAHRLALTGTPMENGTVELWSLFDFLMPGILGCRRNFSRRYACDDVGDDSELESDQRLQALRRVLRPLLLRRTKAVAAPELPPRKEQVLYCTAGRRQARVYESLRLRFFAEVDSLISSGLCGEAALKMLQAMLRLRQAAIIPGLVDSEFSDVPSAKIELLYDRVLELCAEGHRALVFSQFTGVLDEVSLRLDGTGIRLFRLDGSTPQEQRDVQIAGFQSAESSAVFLISLKAGGVGINLTAADYVFLLDPWWNPAVEAQAIDRAHRIGRKGQVFVYRLVTAGTIEEKMLRLQHKKRRLTDAIIRGESGLLRELSADDIRSLFEAVS